MRVRLVVELDIEDFDELEDHSEEQLREASRDAIDNALAEARDTGFDHDLCHCTSIVVAAVHLLKD